MTISLTKAALLCTAVAFVLLELYRQSAMLPGSSAKERIPFYTNTTKAQPSVDAVTDGNGANNTRYLIYYTHSGFSNQIHGLHRAAQLAFATGRVLVLPPVLPHVGRGTKFKKWGAKIAGSGCKVISNNLRFVDRAIQSAQAASRNPFPSFREIVDFSSIQEITGLNVVDMPDFMTKAISSGANISSDSSFWCRPKNGQRLDFEGKCSLNRTRSYEEVVDLFQKEYEVESDCTNAVIGSAYIIRTKFESFNHEASARFDEFFKSFAPSPKFLAVLKEVHERLPEDFVGVHLRFRDRANFQCPGKETAEIKSTFENALKELRKRNVTRGTRILIGRSHRSAKDCFNWYANGDYTATTVNDILEDVAKAEPMISSIQMELDTIYLVLDMLALSLGRIVVTVSQASFGGSTFQELLNYRHGFRDELKLLLTKTEQ